MTEEEIESYMKGYRRGLATALMEQMIPNMVYHNGNMVLEFKQGSVKEMTDRLEKFIETGK